ncbi:hypothetical protein [Actinophytocola algeriensis]|jgi:hypothetical protein|uniref:Uncharacterized protein n=1 Tax=Actinophytocola algeriensis TaxID=1768010 RepID=A0A7W7Q4S6_9PSEU|nr:hypothetical protein [Actinophytocola algeriensis]MBB4906679.1 hypothetical protein [Actinophytocola algeriensis]MBE1478160.1 hypothetical protein [Actinophytocola algeriensis]
MTWWLVVPAVTTAIGSIGWLVVALKRLAVANERTKQALTGCPAAERAAVLEAAGRYAKSLGSRKVR